MLAGDIDPFAAGLYLVAPERRAILPRGDDPRFADVLLARCRARGVDVVVPTVDTELLPLARAARRASPPPASRSCSRREETLERLPRQVGAGRALPRPRARAARPSSSTRRSTRRPSRCR